MKKTLIICMIVVMLISLTACSINKKNDTDAAKFKEEYESLNGKKRKKDGKTIRSIEISYDNPFVYKSADDIIDMINKKETFAVYFGFSDCPWCRSVVPILSEVASDLGIDKVYYVDVLDIRDELVLKDGEVVTNKEGSKDYMKLIKILDNVLEDYTLSDDENEVATGEKRIYAPNVVTVVKGKAVKMESGISSYLTDPYMKLTKKIKKDIYNKFECLLSCVIENNSCSKNAC